MYLALCHNIGTARAMDVNDPGDPGLSVSSSPPSQNSGTGSKGDPGLSISSNPNHPMQGGDPKLAVHPLSPDACAALVRHTPGADVAYQPGTDVHGNAVAPADLPGGTTMQMPKTFQIPLTLSLAKVLNLNTNTYPYNQLGQGTETQIGTLTVSGDRVLFNGKPISDDQQSNLSVLCMKENGK